MVAVAAVLGLMLLREEVAQPTCQESTIDGSYDWPTAYVAVFDETGSHTDLIRDEFERFAAEHGLTIAERWPKLSLIDLDAGPSFKNQKCGVSMLLLSVEETCLTVDVSDRSGAWTREVVDIVDQLTERLGAVDGSKAVQVVRPSHTQDYVYAQRNRIVQEIPTREQMCEMAAR